MFNPVVSHFRIHFFSPRPCFNFCTGESLSEFARKFMTPEKYYTSDPDPQPQDDKGDGQPQVGFSLRRLGRRCKYDRQANTHERAHKFWSAHMSGVAAPEYRGPWFGLGPLRAVFQDKHGERLLRLRSDFLQLGASQTGLFDPSFKLIAFPKLLLCPIGWAVGVVVDVEGELPFDKLPALVNLLRTAPGFLYRKERDSLQLEQMLHALHRMVREALLMPQHRLAREPEKSYLVCSPLTFQGQATFAGDVDLDLPLVLHVLEQDAIPIDDKKRTLTRGPHSLTITRFNRGTMRIVGSMSDRDHQSPECALSNLKNCLLMTEMIEQYHGAALNYNNDAVQKMREELELTFMQLKSMWKSPHFHQICNDDIGLQKMKKAAVTNVYNFIRSSFSNVAIGDQARVSQLLDPGRRTVYLSAIEEMKQMAQSANAA